MNEINRVIVSLDAVRKNIINLKNKAKGKKLFAVVKANGYGLGSSKISTNVEDIVDGYCVSNLEEALELRNAGIKKEILILGFVQAEDVVIASQNDITISLYDLELSKELSRILEDKGLTIRAHIKLDTGHGRLGFLPSEDYEKQILEISKLNTFIIEGAYSHLSTADEKDTTYTEKQHQIFDTMCSKIEEIGVKLDIKHLANDAGLIKHGYKYDLVRTGIGIYGFYPSDVLQEEGQVELFPSFEWISKVSFVKEIQANQAISYGRTFISKKPMKIATVSVGYADGYKRDFSNRAYVLINGRKADIVGRVTMDQMMVDVTDIENVTIGDDVVLVGKSGSETIKLEQLAAWADTITYEIMTSISERVHRLYRL